MHKSFLKNGIDSFIYAGLKSFDEDRIFYNSNDFKLKITGRIERQLLKLYPERDQTPWNIGLFNNALENIIKDLKPDIIHLHWINQFVSIKQITKFNIPVVWTLHDSWAFTGGCHIPFYCEKYIIQCEACPQLKSKRIFDLSTFIFNLKKKSWKNANIYFVGPSKWITYSAKSSKLLSGFKVTNIPNCIDTIFFSSKDKIESRKKLGIPIDKKVILFGANNAINDKNKGYYLLEQAYNEIKKISESSDIELVIFGTKDNGYCDETKIRKLGFITESNQFPFIYSAADVVVNASSSENFSNVILEALSCGTPVVAFNIGGNSDLIKPGVNGDLVAPFDLEELTRAIINQLYLMEISSNTISKSIENFSELNIFNKFLKFYSGLK